MAKTLSLRGMPAPAIAPDWVADAVRRAVPIGGGSYAMVYGCRDGSALKITTDKATMALARRQAKAPVPGLPPVLRASPLRSIPSRRRKPRPMMAVSMPKLSPLSGWRKASVRQLYRSSLLAACRLHGFEGRTFAAARRFATDHALSSPRPRSSFSACLCIQMAARCLGNYQGNALRTALTELASFCQSHGCDIDLMGIDNWMVDSDGLLALSDPVVAKAYAF